MTTEVITKQVDVEGSRESRLEDFGIKDSHGRLIGAMITTWELDFIPHVPQLGYGYHTGVEPGHFFAFRPWATRNGKTYGAAQRYQLFKTIEERNAAIEKYLKAKKKRDLSVYS